MGLACWQNQEIVFERGHIDVFKPTVEVHQWQGHKKAYEGKDCTVTRDVTYLQR